MKQGLFVISRCYTALITLISAALCIPAVETFVWAQDNIAHLSDRVLWIIFAVVYGIAVLIGFFNLIRLRGALPLSDRLSALLAPPILAVVMTFISIYGQYDSTGHVIAFTVLGCLLLLGSLAAAALWGRNTRRVLKQG